MYGNSHSRKRTYIRPSQNILYRLSLAANAFVFVVLITIVIVYRTEITNLILYTPRPTRSFSIELDCRGDARYQHVITQQYEAAKEKQHVPIVVFVPSAVKWADRRELFRKQWAQNLALGDLKDGKDVALYFVVGTRTYEWEPLPAGALKAVRHENRTHGDMVEYDGPDYDLDADIINSDPATKYNRCFVSATTAKVLMGLRYAAAKYTFDYVFRVDNDAYLRIDEFVRSMVPKLPQKRLYLGNFLASNKAGPLWHNYWGPFMPAYATGMGYTLSADMVNYVTQSDSHWRLHHPEDATVPTWWAGVLVNRVQTKRFHDRQGRGDRQAPCTPQSVLIHYVRPADYENNINGLGEMSC